jgi:hypothetical protein
VSNLRIAKLREHGVRLGRSGISARIHALVDEYVTRPSYLAAIQLAGRLRVLSMAASFDHYWNEKTQNGMSHEAWDVAKAVRPPEESEDDIRASGPLTFSEVSAAYERGACEGFEDGVREGRREMLWLMAVGAAACPAGPRRPRRSTCSRDTGR